MRRRHLFLLTLTICFACKDDGVLPPTPPVYVPTVQLSVEDSSCTEIFLRLKLTDNLAPRTVMLRRGSENIVSLSMSTPETSLVDAGRTAAGLLPGSDYTYKAFRINNGSSVDSSGLVVTRTMDTTSHFFTSWQLDTLGDAFSLLHDIAIINDTLAYAVGEMYLRDSTGGIDFHAYNMAKWNGRTWSLQRIHFYTICGQSDTGSYPINAIHVLNSSNVWLATVGGQLAQWNGSAQTGRICLPTSFVIQKLWGEGSNLLYVLGNDGNILFYSGTSWQGVYSGSSLHFRDIWGSRDLNGRSEILALASTYTTETQGVAIVKLSGGTATLMDVTGLVPDVMGFWFSSNRKYVVAGAGVYRKHNLNEPAWVQYPLSEVTRYYTEGVGGADINDVFVCGSRGEVVHFNGIAWRKCFSTPPIPSGALGRISVTKHVVMAIGNIGGAEAVVLIGRR